MNIENNSPPYLPKPINPYCLSPFNLYQDTPTAFGENITYIEYLMGVLKTLNQCIEYLKWLSNRYDNYDEEIADLQNQITTLQNKLNAEIIKLQNKITKGDQNTLIASKVYTDEEVIKLNEKIANITSKLNPIYDPTTGYISPVHVVVMNVYEAGRYDALTAKEYDAFELTCEQFAELGLTAKQYDQHGKTLIN